MMVVDAVLMLCGTRDEDMRWQGYGHCWFGLAFYFRMYNLGVLPDLWTELLFVRRTRRQRVGRRLRQASKALIATNWTV